MREISRRGLILWRSE